MELRTAALRCLLRQKAYADAEDAAYFFDLLLCPRTEDCRTLALEYFVFSIRHSPAEPLVRLLDDPSASARHRADAARALAHTADAAADEALIRHLGSECREIRLSAAYSVGYRRLVDALPALVALTSAPARSHADVSVRAECFTAIGRIVAGHWEEMSSQALERQPSAGAAKHALASGAVDEEAP